MSLSWRKKSPLDEAIDKVHEELRQHDPESKEYETNLRNLERLHALKKENKRRVDPTVYVQGGFTILTVLALKMYDEKHVIRSWMPGFLGKPRARD